MYIAICDDKKDDRNQIRTLLQEHFEQYGYTGEIHSYTSGEALVEAFFARPYDIVFLDIYMDGIDGMKTAAKLRKADPEFALVFITVSKDHAMESFAYRPSYYLTKPIKRRDIDNAFHQCRPVFMKNARYVEVMSDRRKVKIPLVKIFFMEVYGRDVLIHTRDGTIKTTTPLDTLEQAVSSSFLRCHRSYIVNLNYVTSVEQENFRLENGALIPLRQRGRSKLRDAYADFMCSRLFEVSR